MNSSLSAGQSRAGFLRCPRLLVLLAGCLCWLVTGAVFAEGLSRAQLQQFIDEAIAAGGGEVVVPPGRHLLDGPLLLHDAEKIRLVGLETEDCTLAPVEGASKAFPLIRVTGKSKTLRIAKLTLTTLDAAFPDAAESAPLLEVKGEGANIEKIECERLIFQQHQGLGLRFDTVKDSTIRDCVFMDLKGAITIAGKSSEVLVRHSHVIRCGKPAVILGEQSQNCRVIANEWTEAELELGGTGHVLE